MKKLLVLTFLVLFTTMLFSDEKGNKIVKSVLALKKSNDSYYIATMRLINNRNQEKVRKIEWYSKETDEGKNSLIKFLEPADVEGVVFSTIAHKKIDDEQRLFLPALGKIRRISSSKKGGSFMGSDFNYYDLEDHDFEDNTYKYLKEETYDNKLCKVVEYTPLDKNSPYLKTVCWIDKESLFIVKIEFYDNNNNHYKTLIKKDIVVINGIIVSKLMEMTNHIKEHKTILKLENIKFDIGIKNSLFSVQNLTR